MSVVPCTQGGGSLAYRRSLLPQSKKRGWRWVSSMLHRLANRSGFTNLLIQSFRHIRWPGIKFIWPVVCWRTFRSCVAERSGARVRESGSARTERVNIAPFRSGLSALVDALGPIARCGIRGQRLPQTELVRSTVTGQQVARELVVRCPVSGDFFIDTERV